MLKLNSRLVLALSYQNSEATHIVKSRLDVFLLHNSNNFKKNIYIFYSYYLKC